MTNTIIAEVLHILKTLSAQANIKMAFPSITNAVTSKDHKGVTNDVMRQRNQLYSNLFLL